MPLNHISDKCQARVRGPVPSTFPYLTQSKNRLVMLNQRE